MESLKTMENSAETIAMLKARSTQNRLAPGTANHSASRPAIFRTAKKPIHGLREPVLSAIAPRTGDRMAITKPAAAKPYPQATCPASGVSAMREMKYGPKMKVTMTVKNGCAAQSKNIQPHTPRREAWLQAATS